MVRPSNRLNLDGSLRLLRDIHNSDFTEANLATQFRPYYNGPRIEVRTTYSDGTTHTRRGRVGISSGYAPVFLLLPRSDSRSSGDVLHPDDEIIKVIPDWWSRKWGAQHFPIYRAQ